MKMIMAKPHWTSFWAKILLFLWKVSLYKKLLESTREERRPFFLHWELSSECSLRCHHCYQQRSNKYVEIEKAELIINCCEKAGILSVFLTGGEPLSNPHFEYIYRTLKLRGFIVTVCTNATLINRSIVELFTNYPPHSLDISIYGASPKCFRSVTGKDLFNEFKEAVDLLYTHGLNFNLKTPLTKTIEANLGEIEAFAREYDVPFTMATLIYPRLNGDLAPLKHRLPVEVVMEHELKDLNSLTKWKNEIETRFVKANKLRCNYARNTVSIDSSSNIIYCGMLRTEFHHIDSEMSFFSGMNHMNEYRDSLDKIYSKGQCGACGIASVCQCCPAQSYLHTGQLDQCVPYFKALAEARLVKSE